MATKPNPQLRSVPNHVAKPVMRERSTNKKAHHAQSTVAVAGPPSPIYGEILRLEDVITNVADAVDRLVARTADIRCPVTLTTEASGNAVSGGSPVRTCINEASARLADVVSRINMLTESLDC